MSIEEIFICDKTMIVSLPKIGKVAILLVGVSDPAPVRATTWPE